MPRANLEAIERFESEGGLFTVNNGRDMRRTEIWYQMNYYLSEIIKEGSI